MSVSQQDVERVAELANLELSSAEKASMVHDLNSLLDYFSQLNELDTTKVPPMLHALETETTGLRADEIASSLNRAPVLACAPDADGIFFKVPKVIER